MVSHEACCLNFVSPESVRRQGEKKKKEKGPGYKLFLLFNQPCPSVPPRRYMIAIAKLLSLDQGCQNQPTGWIWKM